MKKAYKIPLVMFSVIGVIFSLCAFSFFHDAPLLSDALNDLFVNCDPWLPNIFAGICVLIGLCFLALIIAAIFLPSGEDFLTVDQGGGTLLISGKTIQSTARYSFADLKIVSYADIRAKLSKNPDKSKIFVKLMLKDSTELVSVTEAIRDRIEAALLHSLGVSVKSVTIKIIEPRDVKQFSPFKDITSDTGDDNFGEFKADEVFDSIDIDLDVDSDDK